MNRTLKGLALVPRPQQRLQLQLDTRQWLDKGHRIVRLPPGRARGLCRYDSLPDLLLETGVNCEY